MNSEVELEKELGFVRKDLDRMKSIILTAMMENREELEERARKRPAS